MMLYYEFFNAKTGACNWFLHSFFSILFQIIIHKVDVNKWKNLAVACLMTTTILMANIIQLNTLLAEGAANNKFYYDLLSLVLVTRKHSQKYSQYS
jgi:hypothetical protein